MKNRQRVIRVIAIILAVLLAGGMVVSVLVSFLAGSGYAEEAARDQYAIEMEYLEEEQALRVSQRLVYTNRTPDRLQAVLFYASGNMFRRQSALMYESGDLDAVFPYGYAPAGIDLRAVRFNGEEADWGYQGEEETCLRVACDLAPGESGAFEFEFDLLLMACGAFQGVGEMDVRLSAFYFIPGRYDANYHEFVLKQPLPFTRWLESDAADYEVTLALPAGYAAAGTGARSRDGDAWRFSAKDIREFAVSFGRRWRETTRVTASGVTLRALTNVRGAGKRMLDALEKAVGQCEAWFGEFPVRELTVAQSDYPLGALNFPGVIWLSTDMMQPGRADEMAMKLRFATAQQVFGLAAYVEPSADAWLSDSVCAYIAYLMLEDEKGRDAFVNAINRDWVDALQLTIPGGLTVTSDARLFDGYAYDVVVLRRGAVVMHELRTAMGLDGLLSGLAEFRRMGQSGETLTEMDFVAAMDAASGRSWEAFLTDWVFNVGDYVNQQIDWYE